MTEKKNDSGSAGSSAQPGNMSLRDLAASLSKTAPTETAPEQHGDAAAAGSKDNQGQEQTAAATAGKADARGTTEEPKPDEAQAREQAPPQDEGAETAQQTETETDEQGQTGTEEDPENAPHPTLSPGERELPAELADAMELAKGDGKKGVAQLLKRVHTLVDERDTERNSRLAAAEENKTLRAELEAERSTKAASPSAAPAGVHPEVAAVNRELASVDHWLTWCDEHPEGGEIAEGEKSIAVSDAQVTALRRELANQRQELVARKVATEREFRAAYQSAYTASHAAAVEAFPWVKDKSSREYQEMESILKVFPAFKQSPDYELAIGDFLAGRAARLARAKAGSGGPRRAAPAREPTRVLTTAPANGARRASATETEEKEAEQKFASSGRIQDLAKQFAASRRRSR